MRYTGLASIGLLLHSLVASASIDSHDRRDESLVRLVDRSLHTGLDDSAQLGRRSAAATNQLFIDVVKREILQRQPPPVSTHESQTQQYVKNIKVRRRNDLRKPLVRVRSSRRRHTKREPRHHKPKQSKLEKEVNSAKKLLADDLKREKKDQDKATQKALGSVNKAQNRANKEVEGELKRAKKFQGQDMQRIDKAKQEMAKYASHAGKKDKDAKKYAKALKNEQKAEGDLRKLKEKGRKSMDKIASDEQNMINKSGGKLTKAMKKAHTDQFGDKGARLAKSHPSAWQKFKKVMSKIGEGLEWAVSGLSLLVPGMEELGLARLAAKGAEMIAKKAAQKGISKGAKKGMKDKMQMKNGKMTNVVDLAKTESDADIARAKANEKLGLDQWGNAVKGATRPADNARTAYKQLYGREKQLYGRFAAQRFDYGPWAMGG
ncbi:chromatin modification [Trapelia coarctata]|nr:chromatin modification [Trapelia coarctata]